MEHSTENLIISWMLSAIAIFSHWIDGAMFNSMFLQLPLEDTYDFTMRVIKDVLTILCFIAAFIASIYAIIEKKQNIKKNEER